MVETKRQSVPGGKEHGLNTRGEGDNWTQTETL